MPVLRYMGTGRMGAEAPFDPLPKRRPLIVLELESGEDGCQKLAFTTGDHVLTGKLVLKRKGSAASSNSNTPVKQAVNDSVNGIEIRFEIIATVQFETKVDNRVENHNKVGDIVAREPWARMYVDGSRTTSLHRLPSHDLQYPFTFSLPNNLPTSFKVKLASLQYQISAYAVFSHAGAGIRAHKILTSRPIQCPGHYNLGLEPLARARINLEKSLPAFWQGPALKTNLTVEKSGFVPGDELGFSLGLNNAVGEAIKALQVSLVRKTTYRAGLASKTTSTVLASKRKELNLSCDFLWNEALAIPVGLQPTLDRGRNSEIEIQYLLQMEVISAEREGPIRGDAVILLGTTHGINLDLDPEDCLLEEPIPGTSASLYRERRLSDISLPPNYSALSSRRPSIEALPPGYEETLCIGIPKSLTMSEIEIIGNK